MQAGQCQVEFVAPAYTVVVPETPASDSDVPSTPSAPSTEVTVNTSCSSDVTDPSFIRYAVIGDTTVGSIDETTGEFSVTLESLDYETQSRHSVSLLCYLLSDPSINATAALTIMITPINEYLPTIYTSVSPYTTIPETTPAGLAIAAVDPIGPQIPYNTNDRDGGPDGVIFYYLLDTQQEQFFDMEKSTGTLLLRAAPDIDTIADISESFNINIAACNEHTEVSNCNTLSLMVTVFAANDVVPLFEPPVYPVSLLESAPTESLVAQPLCVDGDNGAGSSVTISFHGETPEIVLETFLLNSAGDVVLQTGLDYDEGPVSYKFELVCSDGDNEAVAEVLVAVLPVNDNPPRFLEDRYEFTVDRSSPSGHIVGRVEAEDEDIDAGSNITYVIDDASYFTIDSLTGDIRIRDYIPSSAGSRFQLQVLASDEDFSANASVTVSVNGALSRPEFAGIVAGVLIFIVLVVIILSLVGVCGCCYIRTTRRR
jgi:protocadherin-16/23